MRNKLLLIFGHTSLLIGMLVVMSSRVEAQEMPPKPVSVSFIRNLNFGAFSTGSSGGSVIVYPSGSRTSTNDVILINFGYLYYPAIFELEGNPGTVIHLLAGSPAILNGNQGGTMTMTIGDADPFSPFILPLSTNGILQVNIGGILTVGYPVANPPGYYNGAFNIMFIQE
ncbi:MAG: DUF4402 domain-containing protein [Bacteroidales bacterium]|nr:DUF4402 domain-containing protein [Bacteroidales bacterium]